MNVSQAHALAHELEELADLLKAKARSIRQALRHPAEREYTTTTPLPPDLSNVQRKAWLP